MALVFQDEFDVPGRPNPEKWDYEIDSFVIKSRNTIAQKTHG
ncbi:MAG: hypothetical protein R2688_06815 [Fimbriimonadaceae bacterium]